MGVLHSWSHVFPEDGSDVVFLDWFRAIKADEADPTLVTVQGAVGSRGGRSGWVCGHG
jgi:hypothetical protein